jgi:anti-sigma-K factor RskA
VAVAAAAVIVVGSAIAVGSAILKDSGNPAHTVALNAPDGRPAVVVHVASNGSAVIQTASLQKPASGHVYQLWSQPKADAPMQSVGVLGRTPSGHRVRIPSPSVRLAISVEPDGGSTQPTTDPVAISDLRAA